VAPSGRAARHAAWKTVLIARNGVPSRLTKMCPLAVARPPAARSARRGAGDFTGTERVLPRLTRSLPRAPYLEDWQSRPSAGFRVGGCLGWGAPEHPVGPPLSARRQSALPSWEELPRRRRRDLGSLDPVLQSGGLARPLFRSIAPFRYGPHGSHMVAPRRSTTRRPTACSEAEAAALRWGSIQPSGVAPMNSPDDVRSSIDKKLASGALPQAAPIQTTEIMGVGLPCSACGLVIWSTDVECLADVPGHALYRFHAACFTEWRRAAAEQRPTES
jgi:hypothetical protein